MSHFPLENTNAQGGDEGPRKVPLPNRAEVRRLATAHQTEIRRVIAAGGNPHQTSIDQSDKVAAYADALGPDDGLLFLNMYNQEVEALAAHTMAEADRLTAEAQRIEAETARQGSYSYLNPRPLEEQDLAEKIGRGIAGALIIAFLFWLFT